MDIVTDGPVLHLSGDVDVRSTWEVRNAVYDHLSVYDDVVVDLAEVDAIDMTALKVLAVATRTASLSGRRLTLRDCSAPVLRMLHLTRLIRLCDVERVPVSA